MRYSSLVGENVEFRAMTSARAIPWLHVAEEAASLDMVGFHQFAALNKLALEPG
jgi:hypothetical protein